MTQQPLTWKLFGAFLLVLVATIVGIPFALAGFAWQFICAAFETGRGTAAQVNEWMREQ